MPIKHPGILSPCECRWGQEMRRRLQAGTRPVSFPCLGLQQDPTEAAPEEGAGFRCAEGPAGWGAKRSVQGLHQHLEGSEQAEIQPSLTLIYKSLTLKHTPFAYNPPILAHGPLTLFYRPLTFSIGLLS